MIQTIKINCTTWFYYKGIKVSRNPKKSIGCKIDTITDRDNGGNNILWSGEAIYKAYDNKTQILTIELI